MPRASSEDGMTVDTYLFIYNTTILFFFQLQYRMPCGVRKISEAITLHLFRVKLPFSFENI